MNYRIINNKVVLRDGSAVSVPPNHFDDTVQNGRYYGVVLRLIQNGKQAQVQWIEDNAKSIEDIEHLQLEAEIPQKLKKFILSIKPKDQSDDVQFEMQNLTPRDSSTPGNPRCFCYMLEIVPKFYFDIKKISPN